MPIRHAESARHICFRRKAACAGRLRESSIVVWEQDKLKPIPRCPAFSRATGAVFGATCSCLHPPELLLWLSHHSETGCPGGKLAMRSTMGTCVGPPGTGGDGTLGPEHWRQADPTT